MEQLYQSRYTGPEIDRRLGLMAGNFLWIKWSATYPVATMLDEPGPYIGIYTGEADDPPEDPAEYKWYLNKGDTGTGLDILGTYPTVEALEAAVTSPAQGDMYNVGLAAPFNVYMWDVELNDWIDQGVLHGVPGPNEITTATATPLSGVLVGKDGAVKEGVAGEDFAAAAHAAQHAADGEDPIPLSAIGAESNANLFDNWYYPRPVNQRGVSGLITTLGYFIDRWKLVSGSVTITENGLTLNGTIAQVLELAAGTDVTASVRMHSGTATISYDNTAKTATITSAGGTISAAKLEYGSISTLAGDSPPNYAEQLALCQRYYFQRHFTQYETIAMGYLGAAWLNLALGIGSPMRTNEPTLTITVALALMGAQPSTALTPVNAACSGCIANLGFSTTASVPGACYAYTADAAGATISLSADL